MYGAFIDYQKAFDLVDRSSLWSKLIGFGLNGKIFTVIYNLYLNAKSCVKSGYSTSEFFLCNIGVRQGENLSPLLFALFLNDFEQFVSKSYRGLNDLSNDFSNLLSDDDVEVFFRLFVLLYADDTIVLAETPEELQKALDAVFLYCQTWKLNVNIGKTKIVIFSRGVVRNKPTFKFGDRNIEVCQDYVYLGSTVNYNGSFMKAINKQVNQARRALYSLKSKWAKLELPIDVQCELFDRMIMPIALYGCEIWGSAKIDQVNMFHKKFLKSLLRVGKSTANCMVLGELGRMTLEPTIHMRMLNFWIKIVTGKKTKLSFIMYQLMKKMHDEGIFKCKWITKVKGIIDSTGFSHVWHNINDINIRKFKKDIQLRLQDMARQDWSSEVHRNSLCTNYRLIKDTLELEQPLLTLNFQDRVSLTKFRCSNHNLPVSNNRFLGQEINYTCTLCNSIDVADEYHFVLVCPALRDERRRLIPRRFYQRPNVIMFKELFQIKDILALSNLAKFIRIIMGKFN